MDYTIHLDTIINQTETLINAVTMVNSLIIVMISFKVFNMAWRRWFNN